MVLTGQQSGDGMQLSGQSNPPVNAQPTSNVPQNQAENPAPQAISYEEHEALVRKAVSDALSAPGRQIKELQDTVNTLTVDASQVQTLNQTIEELRQRNIAAEIEAAKDNPKAYDFVKRLHEVEEKEMQLRNLQNEIKKDQAKWETTKQELTSWQVERNVNTVATANQVSPDALKKLVPDGNIERLNEAATILKGSAAAAAPQQAAGAVVLKRGDSGIGSGASQNSIRSMIEKAKSKPTK